MPGFMRGGKNYKKKTQMPEWDLNILDKTVRDREAVKQPFDTNQPYAPAKQLSPSKPEDFTKKSG